MPVFHKNIHLPKRIKGIVPNSGEKSLKYTNHALKAAKNDRYGQVNLPNKLEMSKVDIIEVEVWDFADKENQYTLRSPYSANHDITFVVIPQGKTYLVKTLWLNEKSDDGPDRGFTYSINRYEKKK